MALGHHPETSPNEKLRFKFTKMGWAGIHGKSNPKDFYREKGGMADKAKIIEFAEGWKKYLLISQIILINLKLKMNSQDDHSLILRQRGKLQMAQALSLSIRPLLKGKNFQL